MANPNTNAAKNSDVKPDDVLNFTSIAEGKAPIEMELAEEYANKKGIPVKVTGKNGAPIEGRLVEWKDDNAFRVVWKENGMIMTEIFDAAVLYSIPENSRLKGAVEFCRAHADEVQTERSQISNMLSTINEPGKLAA